jgi:hypothetical protein
LEAVRFNDQQNCKTLGLWPFGSYARAMALCRAMQTLYAQNVRLHMIQDIVEPVKNDQLQVASMLGGVVNDFYGEQSGGFAPIHWAVRSDLETVVGYFLDTAQAIGAYSIAGALDNFGRPPLAYTNNRAIIKRLFEVQKTVDIDQFDCDGKSLFWQAYFGGRKNLRAALTQYVDKIRPLYFRDLREGVVNGYQQPEKQSSKNEEDGGWSRFLA